MLHQIGHFLMGKYSLAETCKDGKGSAVEQNGNNQHYGKTIANRDNHDCQPASDSKEANGGKQRDKENTSDSGAIEPPEVKASDTAKAGWRGGKG